MKVRFWVWFVVASILGLGGFLLASAFPVPALTSIQTKVLYTIIGVLVAALLFAKVASWIVTTVTRLTRLLILKLAAEIINQLTHLASSGIHLLPAFSGQENEQRKNYSLTGQSPIILDTSALIDGRILDVAKTGFIYGLILVPDFVLRELQQVADSSDDIKRQRGRRGFEIIDQLKKIEGIKVDVWDKAVAGKSVDDKLIKLGRIVKGRVLTADFNLNQVAMISMVRVLNLNKLANSLKFLAVPGERLAVKLIHPGKDSDQGVGYLDDGTMVVVKGGAGAIGKSVDVEVNKNIQGPAGRMIFGKLVVSDR